MVSEKNKSKPPFDPEAFRDTISTVDQQGNRKWIFPKKPKGRYHNARAIVAVILIGLMAIGPFLRFQGDPMFLFNFLERKFIIFGVTFWPQDFHLFFLAMITFFVFIVLFTVVFGRVWCGWACPQTIFMEMVFRKIEYWIEGDFQQQMKLSKAPWGWEKLAKKGGKQLIFLFLSFLIGNLMMAYIVGTDRLGQLISQGPGPNLSLFTGVAVFSLIFYGVFAWFREQACIVVCPYGRLQGVLLGKDSLVVAYDYVRGEPRGPIRKANAVEDTAPKGDCIDCKLCVHVCPTGIDIRNGTQLECVNCTACIDACDEVMDKVGRPRGLVRVDSEAGIQEGKSGFQLTPRIVAYSVVLMALVTFLTVALITRAPVEATIIRTAGMLYQKTDDGYISNLYNLQVVNKTVHNYDLEIRLIDREGRIKVVGNLNSLPKQGITTGVFFVELPKSDLKGLKNKVKIGLFHGETLLDETTVQFMGPPL